MGSNTVSGDATQRVVVVETGRQTVWWVIAVLLAVIATALVFKWDDGGVVYGQNVARAGAAGIFALSGQISRESFGVFMVDVDTGVIWAYEIAPGTPKKMRLIAARSYMNDRYLEEFNVDKPTPQEVETLVQGQRTQQSEVPAGSGPTGTGTKQPGK